MDIVLVDTSVWINLIKDARTPAAIYLESEINKITLATCPTIIQEVLQGVIKDKDYKELKQYFGDLLLFDNDPYDLAIKAAEIYRTLRKNGITIRKPNDCLIAAYAIYHSVALLHEDKDFINIAKYSNLNLVSL